MTTRSRRFARPLVAILAIGLALLAAACGPSGPSAPATVRPSSSSPSTAPASPDLTPVPGGLPTPFVGPTVGPPTTTDTEFGRIWDSLPDTFPRMARSTPVDEAGPVSAAFATSTDVETASRGIGQTLMDLGWSVDIGSPLEDGTVILEATGPPAGCKAEVRFTPMSGTVVMSVLYGAECPFG